MRYTPYHAALVALTAAAPTLHSERSTTLRTIELAPDTTKQVTELEKSSLIKNGTHFIDITDWPTAPTRRPKRREYIYPTELTQSETVLSILAQLNQTDIEANLNTLTSFNNRYYQSETGNQSAEWLLGQARNYIPADSPVRVDIFPHEYRQSSIVARIPGQSEKTIVVGAHMDSINGEADLNRTTARAPGADDNGTGSTTLLSAFRALLSHPSFSSATIPHTIEFHWYAAEEVGLLGSGNIFRSYAEANRPVVAMLNQDMTGYTAGYAAHNMTPKFGVVTDNTDAPLTDFMRRVIREYTSTEAADTQCGYACSDHASATRAGFPSAFVFEGEMHGVNDNPYVHSAKDTVETVDFGHVMEHARMVVGFVVELTFAALEGR